ncbi:MAG: hypothetical protein GF309_06835 [Candidatus Lokiarchaeota archaeon]|nr:hypothetical protein [Candidatus Lokiarchaeota archaeon]
MRYVGHDLCLSHLSFPSRESVKQLMVGWKLRRKAITSTRKSILKYHFEEIMAEFIDAN